MSNFLKAFRVPLSIPINLFGPVGRGDNGELFYKFFRAKQHPKDITVVAQKNEKTPGAFSLLRLGDTYDIAFYPESTGKQVWSAITEGKADELDPIYRTSDPSHKYIYMDLVEILKEFNMW